MYPNHHLSIHLNAIGKKFGNEWIFKNIELEIKPGEKWVILGGNGSGKSTLLQIISGYILPNSGSLSLEENKMPLEAERYKNYFSLASPYLELIDEFTLPELIKHTRSFKPFYNKLSDSDISSIAELSHVTHKPLKTYSSGMKQRVKLALAILADCPVLLLDEPVSNLDKSAINWYNQMIKSYAGNKTIIVCSNSINEEFDFCDNQIDLTKYK